MSFISLPIGKLYRKIETKKFKKFPVSYIGRFYRNLTNNIDSSVNENFCGKMANAANIPSEGV